jgi:hypothetical protein
VDRCLKETPEEEEAAASSMIDGFWVDWIGRIFVIKYY